MEGKISTDRMLKMAQKEVSDLEEEFKYQGKKLDEMVGGDGGIAE